MRDVRLGGIVLPEASIDPTAQSMIAHALEPGEELVWAGRPDPVEVVRSWRRDMRFMLGLFGFAAVALALAVVAGGDMFWFVFWLLFVGGILALVLPLTGGREGSAYGLTRRRAILYLKQVNGARTEIVDIADIDNPPRVHDLGNGKADITIRTGVGDDPSTVFQAVDDAEAIVALIQQLRTDDKSPGKTG